MPPNVDVDARMVAWLLFSGDSGLLAQGMLPAVVGILTAVTTAGDVGAVVVDTVLVQPAPGVVLSPEPSERVALGLVSACAA